MSKKYRPYLSLPMMERISYVLGNLKASGDMLTTLLDREIIDTMRVMILKANHGITQPSFTPIVDKLGIPEPEWKEQTREETLEEMRYTSGQMNPEESLAYEQKLMAKITG